MVSGAPVAPQVQHDVPLGTGAAGSSSGYLNLVMSRGLLRDDHNHGEFMYSDEDSALSFVGEDTWTALAAKIADCMQLAIILFMTTFGQTVVDGSTTFLRGVSGPACYGIRHR